MILIEYWYRPLKFSSWHKYPFEYLAHDPHIPQFACGLPWNPTDDTWEIPVTEEPLDACEQCKRIALMCELSE